MGRKWSVRVRDACIARGTDPLDSRNEGTQAGKEEVAKKVTAVGDRSRPCHEISSGGQGLKIKEKHVQEMMKTTLLGAALYFSFSNCSLSFSVKLK
jgi:hypothetical protein